ncbi:hypothetical protein C0966_17595 (plasmid) [Bacillus methanolicus]|nr:hypothetical protein [Bacillus methanolicus]
MVINFCVEVNDENGIREEINIIQIDRYFARESRCGPNYKKLMEKRLPNSREFHLKIKKGTHC